MGQIIERYLTVTGTRIPERDDREQIYNEFIRMKKETHNLQLSLHRYKGDDLSSAQYEDLAALEQQLESSVIKVRARKFQLLQQQLDNLKRTEEMLEKENQEMYSWLMSNHIQKQQEQLDHHQQAMTELKLVGGQQVLDQYTFFGEEQPSDILQHASVPPQLQPYRLQPTQPNLQEPSLQECSYEQ